MTTRTSAPATRANGELAFASALELAELIRRKETSPPTLTELYLDRIERLNPALNAYLTIAADQAKAAAKAAESRMGDADPPPFLGVPISIKDLNDTAGIRTTRGCAGYRDRVPDTDEAVVRRLKRAGFIVLGKTNSPEFGIGVFTEPVGYDPCRNPWNLERTPGGSSGGAGSALMAGLSPVSHGSDGGGSIRIPSAWCGAVGLKPSRGRISAAPAPQSMSATNGALTRTVSDTAALIDIMAGYEPGDAFWAPPFEQPLVSALARAPGRLRVAVTATRTEVPVHPEWSAAALSTAALLAELGHDVEEAAPPWTPLDPEHPIIKSRCALMAASEPDLPAFEVLDPFTQWFIEVGRTLSTRDVFIGDVLSSQFARRLVEFFSDYDVLITPTTAGPPPLVGSMRNEVDPSRTIANCINACPFTADWNLTGQPAISLPLYADASGLPIGVQLVGRPAREDVLISLAGQLEQALPWRDRRPALA